VLALVRQWKSRFSDEKLEFWRCTLAGNGDSIAISAATSVAAFGNKIVRKEPKMSRMSDSSETAGGSASDQLKDSAQQVTQNLRSMGSQARDAANEKFNALKQQANEYYDQGRERAQEWEQGLEQYVQDKPIQSLLIAAGVGLVLGILWKRS
jgi:ElaB/YqjD/DUF883 family membrane-anchored ribosome-binding protein